MLAHKRTIGFVAAAMALAVCLCLCAVAFSGQLFSSDSSGGLAVEYETALFDTSEVLQINIRMDEADWQDMLDNATAEEYYPCDVEIGGETFYQVGIRPKGNTSLTAIASDPTTDRYSFKLEFDHYVDGQTCFGLDKLVLNNSYADATNMKEALIYDMFQYLGADASLYNYAAISVNGSYWGVYVALEAVEDSFLLRNYGAENGALYKPDSMDFGDIGGGGQEPPDSMPEDMPDFSAMQGQMPQGGDTSAMPDFGGMTPPDGAGAAAESDSTGTESAADSAVPPADASLDTGEMPENGAFSFDPSEMPDGGDFSFDAGEMPENGDFSFDAGEMPDGGEFSFDPGEMPDSFGGFFMGGNGANLNYTDDDLDSYSAIWDGEVTDTGDKDHRRVVKALENIAAGTDLEQYMDIDNLLRYMAVHVFSVNDDSLTGMMAHNYYLYESDSQLNIIPWDYNLALGGMGGMGSNDAYSVVNDAIDNAFTGTEFFDTLLADETYLTQYHDYMRQLVDEYINGGGFESFYNRVRGQIDELVETDPTAFYTYEEYLTAVDTLYQVVMLRGESISGQLDGTIPSTAAEQSGSDALVDASGLDISVMGTMNMGGGFGGGMPGSDTAQDAAADTENPQAADADGQTAAEQEASNEDAEAPVEQQSGTAGQSNPANGGAAAPQGGGEPSDSAAASGAASDGDKGSRGRPDRSFGGMPGSWGGSSSAGSSMQNLIWYGVCFVVLLGALLFAVLYRRRPR